MRLRRLSEHAEECNEPDRFWQKPSFESLGKARGGRCKAGEGARDCCTLGWHPGKPDEGRHS